MGGGGHGNSGDDEIPFAYALGMGFSARGHYSSRFASRRRALPLQVTRQRLRCRQGKTAYSILLLERLNIHSSRDLSSLICKNGS